MTYPRSYSFVLGLGAVLLATPACDDGSSGGGNSGTTTTGSDTDPNPDPSLPGTTTTGLPDPGTTTTTTPVDTDPDSDTDPGSSSSGSGSTTTGEPGGCVDEDIGGAIGDAVASGNTEGASDDFDLRYCDGGFGSTSTSGPGGMTTGMTTGMTSATTDPTGFGTTGGFETTGGVAGDGGDYVVSWTPAEGGTYTISTAGSGIDTVLSIAAPECGGDALACNDDCEQLQSSVVYEASAAETVYIVVEGYAGRRGDFVLSISQGDTQECDFGGSTGTTTGADSIGTSP